MDLITQIIILVVLVFLSAIFSGTETALVSTNIIKVKALLKQKKKGSKALYRLKQNPQKLIVTILICNNLVNIGAAAFATIVFTEIFGSAGVGIATGVMTFLILVFGEITPKSIAIHNSEKVSLAIARPLEILSFILAPLIWFFWAISKFITNLFGVKETDSLSEEELRTIVSIGRQQGVLKKEAAEMMHKVLTFKLTKVTEIMTSQIRMEVIDGDKKLKDLLTFVTKSPYSKFPVYLHSQENIIGALSVDDILIYVKNKKLNTKARTLAKKIMFIPETKPIDELLIEFEGIPIPMAVVVNEYSKVEGLVTLEDVLEEIVGDIFDKSKRHSVFIKKIKKDLVRVDAKITVEEINKLLHLGLHEGHFSTLAGFIESHFKRIPKKGERIRLKKVSIVIDKATKKGIKSVVIKKH